MLAVVLITSGVSYAIFTSYSSQSDANTLAASCMDLEFNGQNDSIHPTIRVIDLNI